MPSPQRKRIESTKKPRRRLLLPPSLVAVKSARESFIIRRATDAFKRRHLIVVPFPHHNIDQGSRYTLDLLPSLLHHASRTPQVFAPLLRPATITLVSIVVSLGIFLKSALTPAKPTLPSKGHLWANPSRANSGLGFRKDKMCKGENQRRKWDKSSIRRWRRSRRVNQ